MERSGYSRILPCLAVAIFMALGGAGTVTAVETPEVEPVELTVAASGAKVSFSMFGTDLRLFTAIRIVSDTDDDTDGIRVAMGRARGERRNASIRTTGATPGSYSVELVDMEGEVVTLDLAVIVEGFEAPSVPDVNRPHINIPIDGGRESFSMQGPDVGSFTAIRVVSDGDGDTDGIVIRMGRARGQRRNASIRTNDAEPGEYSVELVHGQGGPTQLGMTLLVFELAAPRVRPERIELALDGQQVDFELRGPGLSLFEEIHLLDDEGGDNTEGMAVGMSPRAAADRRGAWARADDGASPGLYRVELLDGDGEVYELDLEIAVEGEPPQDEGDSDVVAEDDDRSFGGGGGGSFDDDVDQMVVAKAFNVEINGEFIPVVSYSGGDITGEKAEASSGSSQHNESTMGHNYITNLTLESFFTADSHMIQDLVMGWIQESGGPVDVAITELAKDKSVVKTYVYSDCIPVSYQPPRVAANASELLKHQLTLKPARLEVSSAEPNPEEYFAPEARDLLYSFLEALVPSAEAAQTESDQMIFSKYFELEVVGIYQSVPGAVSVFPGTVYWSSEEATRGDKPDWREYTWSFDRFEDWTIEVQQGPGMINLQKYADDALKEGAQSRTFSVRFLARDKSTVLGSMHALGTPVEVMEAGDPDSQVKRIQYTIEVENLTFGDD